MNTPTEKTDAEKFHPGYGHGGVPWYLLLFYLAFLSFFTWYVLEYQLDDYLEQREANSGQVEADGG